jgi:hypothetical protein
MRLIRQFAVSVGLSVVLASSVAVGLVAVGAGSATAAVTNPPGNAFASADPSSATPSTAITFQITCAGLDASSATFFGTTLGLPEQVPMDKESGDGVFSVTVTLPGNIAPGTYHPDMDCDDGSSATATLHVTALPGQGGAQTGDGATSTQSNTGLAALGLGLIAAGAVAGGIAVRRRSSGRRP